MHSCMIVSDNICSLKSSPMKRRFSNDLFLLLVIANSSSSFRAARLESYKKKRQLRQLLHQFPFPYCFCIVNFFVHALPALKIFLALVKLLLALGKEHSSEVGLLRLTIFRLILHLDGTHHFTQVGIGNTVYWLFQSLWNKM